jgi:hypothetical protein
MSLALFHIVVCNALVVVMINATTLVHTRPFCLSQVQSALGDPSYWGKPSQGSERKTLVFAKLDSSTLL